MKRARRKFTIRELKLRELKPITKPGFACRVVRSDVPEPRTGE